MNSVLRAFFYSGIFLGGFSACAVDGVKNASILNKANAESPATAEAVTPTEALGVAHPMTATAASMSTPGTPLAVSVLNPSTVASSAPSATAPVAAMPVTSPAGAVNPVNALNPANVSDADAISAFCKEISLLYARNKWGKESFCPKIPFKIFGWTVEHRPILYFETGASESKKLTIIQCGIHGDELPATPMCLNLIEEIITGKNVVPKETRLIVQPLLNPDGMFKKTPTRTNAHGTDINRNFPTKDWAANAVKSWKKREKANSRKFPGPKAKSEPETEAIVHFIETQKPQKIISIHTPLGFWDLDAKGGVDQRRRARYLAINMSKNSGNYKFINFGFYPGSLGNFAGQERAIPVYTLELPPGESASTVANYWKKFRVALWRAIDFDLETGHFNED